MINNEDFEREIEADAAHHARLVQLWLSNHQKMALKAINIMRDCGFYIPPSTSRRKYIVIYRLGRFQVSRKKREGHDIEPRAQTALALLELLGRFHHRTESFHLLEERRAIGLFVLSEAIGTCWAVLVGQLNGLHDAKEALATLQQTVDQTFGKSQAALAKGNRTRSRRRENWQNALAPFARKLLALNPPPAYASIVAQFRATHPHVNMPASDGPAKFVGTLWK